MRCTVDQRIIRAVLPCHEGATACRNVYGDAIERIALAQLGIPALGRLALMDRRYKKPGYAGSFRNELISGLGGNKPLCNRVEISGQPDIGPALRVRRLE